MNTKKNNQCTSHGENKYTRIMMKSNYKNTQNKLQEDYVNWFIELIKKRYLKTISFPKISNDFIKNNFEWVISIYLFTKYFLQVIWFNFICI